MTLHPVTALRLRAVLASGFECEEDMADALLKVVGQIGSETLKNNSISEDQRRGVMVAMNDTPLAFAEFRRLISAAPVSLEDRSNLLFMLIKTLDDMLSLGAVALVDKAETSFSTLGRTGGKKSGETRRRYAEDGWMAKARPVIVEVCTPRQHSQDVVVDLVKARLKGLPSARFVKQLVSKMEKEGQIKRLDRRSKPI